MSKDSVQRETFMRAPIDKVFAALTDPSLFPTWGPEKVTGRIAAGERPIFDWGWSGKTCVYIVAVEAPRYFAYRWIQGVFDPEVLLTDPLAHPNNTLVEFHLEERDGGTSVRVTESDLAKLPAPEGLNVEESLANMGKGWELMLSGLPRHFQFTGGDTVRTEVSVAAPASKVHGLLLTPAAWWMGAPPVEVSDRGPTHVAYAWKQGDVTITIEFRLSESGGATQVVQTASGFASAFETKKAHQMWGVIMGMLQMATAA